jgi:cytochrome c-type biogenesis protein CcmH
MKIRRLPFALLLSLLAISATVYTALAQASTPQPRPVTDDQVNAVAKELYCPVCENIPLDVCPTQACAQWRDLIREKLSQGWSKDQIKEYFRQQYGDRVLSQPPQEGLNLLVYILPPVFFAFGIFLVYRVLRQRKPAAAARAPVVTPADDPYLRRMEEELKKRN